MLPSWLDGRGATEFGKQIANDIRHLMPLEKGAKVRKSPAKRLQKLARIVERTSAQSAQHRFNFYQRAKFANALRWSLKDSGYTPDFIEEVVALILARM
jgi:hypothetical protein